MEYSFNWNAISTGAPYVTISDTTIAINETAIVMMDTPDKILIGFDRRQKIIGIKRFNGETDADIHLVKDRVLNGWLRIGCKDFIRYLSSVAGVDFSASKRYLAEYDNEIDIFLVRILKGSVTQDD